MKVSFGGVFLEKLYLGIELGSTRVKSVLVNEKLETEAIGAFEWENSLIDGYWTYGLDEVWSAIQGSYHEMKSNYLNKTGETITQLDGISVSAMMHGFLAFNKEEEILTPFRTWRNGNTTEAVNKLTDLFEFNIPHRWSIAHLYQVILDQDEYVQDIDFVTTLAGYVHYKLTGERVIGIGDASGIMPIDSKSMQYDVDMVDKFNALPEMVDMNWNLLDVLPKPLLAGEIAGELTTEGASLLDTEGDLNSGIKLSPPEGDAGTGMVATNSVRVRTGNVSAGTSAFLMVVLEKQLEKIYSEIDMVTTPDGLPVAMVHVNNCTSDINAWINLFHEFTSVMGMDIDKGQIFEKLFNHSESSSQEKSGLLSYGYISGENITHVESGRPLFVRQENADFSLANFMKAHLYAAFATIGIGVETLEEENIEIDSIVGHGGIFKTEGVAQRVLSSVMKSPVSVAETASEGGAWGGAVLASYLDHKEINLADYLASVVFANTEFTTIEANIDEINTFKEYLADYKKALPLAQDASKYI